MPLVNYALITVGQAKTFLGITGQDELLTDLINAVTTYIESKCHRRFKESTYTQELLDGKGSYEVTLKNYPVTTFTLLEKRNATDNTNSWNTVDTDDYYIDTDSGLLTSVCKFSNGIQNYRATYTAGYATIPYDLQYACAVIVGDFLKKAKSAGIKLESLGDHSITFEAISMTNPAVMDIINKYKSYALA